jgi:hypothetical protein
MEQRATKSNRLVLIVLLDVKQRASPWTKEGELDRVSNLIQLDTKRESLARCHGKICGEGRNHWAVTRVVTSNEIQAVQGSIWLVAIYIWRAREGSWVNRKNRKAKGLRLAATGQRGKETTAISKRLLDRIPLANLVQIAADDDSIGAVFRCVKVRLGRGQP